MLLSPVRAAAFWCAVCLAAPTLADTFYRDQDNDTYGTSLDTVEAPSAPAGYVAISGDCNDTNPNIRPGATELCNGVDDDCDTFTDEGLLTTYYRDADGDGYGSSASGTTTTCSQPAGYVLNSTDCNDNNSAIHPAATEVCDPANVDEDCDGVADNQDVSATGKTVWYRDVDGDGYGTFSNQLMACDQPAGYVSIGSDCNDNNPSIRPGAVETCNSLDDDCDSVIDEGVKSTYYRDADSDGYGTFSNTVQACSPPAGYVANGTDCNDSNPAIHPGATELCDPGNVDEDCDGMSDNNDPSATGKTTWYRDADSDGYGAASNTVLRCDAIPGYVALSGDCDDNDPTIHPGVPEACDGVDEDCDSVVDNGSAPAINDHPDNQVIAEGAAVTFIVVADADGNNFTYVWKKGTQVISDGARISGSGTYALTIDPVQAGDAGQYTCTVTGNLCNAPVVTNPATLTVDGGLPSSVVTGPSTMVGSPVTLNFTASDGGGSGIALTRLYVRGPSSSVFSDSGLSQTGTSGSFSYAPPQGGGPYDFASRATDNAGNHEPAPTEPDVTVMINPAPNGPFTNRVAAPNDSLYFVMEEDIGVTISLSGATPGGTITTSRTVPLSTVPSHFQNPSGLLDEALHITGSGLGAFTATVEWAYDPASDDALGSTPVNAAFRFSGGPTPYTFGATASEGVVTITGVDGFSDWYVGNYSSAVPVQVSEFGLE